MKNEIIVIDVIPIRKKTVDKTLILTVVLEEENEMPNTPIIVIAEKTKLISGKIILFS